MDDFDNEKAWLEFTQTGSVYSYLKYKGITQDINTKSEIICESKTEDEPIAYH